MASQEQLNFLQSAFAAAQASDHLWPAYAACETVLESTWGTSQLATQARNLFGQKQSHPQVPGTGTLMLPTREFLHGAWITVQANWASFPTLSACFSARMELLRTLSTEYPNYAAALAAMTGEDFITCVSRTWSTDPERAAKVLEIYQAHGDLLQTPVAAPAPPPCQTAPPDTAASPQPAQPGASPLAR